MQAEGLGICGRFVLPSSTAFQQYGVKAEPAEITVFCLCSSKLWNKTVKLHMTQLFTFEHPLLPT